MAMRTVRVLCLGLVAGGLAAGAADAATWRVEKDGSGDFMIIQQAVEAAADGDTIRIGAGRFDDVATNQDLLTNVFLDGQKSLVLAGAGSDATIIGPEALSVEGVRYGIAGEYGPSHLRVEHLAIVNANECAMSLGCDFVRVEDCLIEGALKGINYVGGSLELVNCRFRNGPPGHSLARAVEISSPHALVQDVEISGYRHGIHVVSHVPVDVRITGCGLDGGGVDEIGIYAWYGDTVVEHCRLTGWAGAAIMVGTASIVELHDNVVEDSPGTGVDFHGAEDVVMHGNLIRGCGSCVVVRNPNRQQSIRRNSFLRDQAAGGWFVNCDTPWFVDPDTLDFTGNYWGTTDPATIDGWINDGNDSGSGLIIDYLPLLDSPVPVRRTSAGGLRAIFR